MDIFYNKMKEIRKDADKSQQDIADALKITRQQYQLYESGKRYIPVDLLKTFCEYFKVSADYILGLAPDLDWPREERGKKRYTNGCTKYIFLYVKYIATFGDGKAGLSACFYRYCVLLWGTYRKSL